VAEIVGAAGVWDETEDYSKQVKATLALNQVGGESVLNTGEIPAGSWRVRDDRRRVESSRSLSTRELIFKDVQLRGF